MIKISGLDLKDLLRGLKKTLRVFFLAVYWFWFLLKTVFLFYAVLFSVAGTIALYSAYKFIMEPVRQVQALQLANPKESAYMARYRATLQPDDTLSMHFVPLDSISKNLQQAVLAAEDDGFYIHPGFDIEAMLSAMEYNRISNGIKRGASTITQQLAKNMFLTGERNFERKVKELMYTVLLERYLGKKRILELYLNYAQWGKTIFGCEAASRIYYKKPCKTLSRREASRLAAVLAMPGKLTPLNVSSAFIGKRISVIANNLLLHHQINDSVYFELTGTPAPGKDTADTFGGVQGN